jgi:hypothetical protein
MIFAIQFSFAVGILATLTTFLGFDGAAVLGMVAIWLRIEHRLSHLETHLEDLPCRQGEKCQ